MEIQSIFAFTLTLTLLFFFGVHSARFTFKNGWAVTVWPGILTGLGKPVFSGLELVSQASSTLDTSPPWSGRMWARTNCATNASGKFTCATGDCDAPGIECNGAGGTPPASLVEFTLAENGGLDFYDVSLVDGFNLPLSIIPQGGIDNCSSTSCLKNVNLACPPELMVKESAGSVIAYKSACLAFNQPQYCCTGDFRLPETCLPTTYSKVFKDQCPQAYGYAYDDKSSTFTCTGGVDYVITFCPSTF